METQKIEIKENCALIVADNAMLDNASFTNVSMCDASISDANLSNLKIDGAQIGGAIFKNIGLPDEDHPNFVPNQKNIPVRFEMCDLNEAVFDNCDLRNVNLQDCNIEGLKINGMPIEEYFGKSK